MTKPSTTTKLANTARKRDTARDRLEAIRADMDGLVFSAVEQEGLTVSEVARAARVSRESVYKALFREQNRRNGRA